MPRPPDWFHRQPEPTIAQRVEDHQGLLVDLRVAEAAVARIKAQLAESEAGIQRANVRAREASA